MAERLVRESPSDYPGNLVAAHIGAASQVKINPQLVVISLSVLVIHCIVHPNGIPVQFSFRSQNTNWKMLYVVQTSMVSSVF